MINEAFFALMEGVATAEDIDRAMKQGTNHPMGPLAVADLIGAPFSGATDQLKFRVLRSMMFEAFTWLFDSCIVHLVCFRRACGLLLTGKAGNNGILRWSGAWCMSLSFAPAAQTLNMRKHMP